MKQKIIDNEIDLIKIFKIIFDNKFRVILITLLTIILILGYSSLTSKITAISKIEPISIFDQDSYLSYNTYINQTKLDETLGLKVIARENLQNLFLAKIYDPNIFVSLMNKYELVDDKKFKDKNTYNEHVKKLALKLVLLAPDISKKKIRQKKKYWLLKFEINNKEKWNALLHDLNKTINRSIKNELISRFKIQKKTAELILTYKLKDIDKKINNAKDDYEIDIKKKLAFLEEQAAIARKLEIKNNTIGVENISSASYDLLNLNTKDTPYYMRGYNMIEKEMELIKSRSDVDSFTKNLIELRNKKRDLIENKDLERIERLLLETPIFRSKNFKAANIIVRDTKYVSSLPSYKYIIIFSVIFGLIFGIIFVLINNAIQEMRR